MSQSLEDFKQDLKDKLLAMPNVDSENEAVQEGMTDLAGAIAEAVDFHIKTHEVTNSGPGTNPVE